MEVRALGDRRVVGFQALYAQAKQVLSNSANQLRALATTSRELSAEAVAGWHRLRDELDELTRNGGSGEQTRRSDLERAVAISAAEIARQNAEIERLEIAARTLESSWMFLEHGRDDASTDTSGDLRRPQLEMRILAAQESERARLAQEIHDGPAQVLSNAIFQIEYIDRLIERDEDQAKRELRVLRDQLQHEMEEMRSYIHALQNPLIGELGLNGAMRDYAQNLARVANVELDLDLDAPEANLSEGQQTVAFRVLQEALRNVRRHAKAKHVRVTTRMEGETDAERNWVLEVRDDGVGFPVEQTMLRAGQRNFGLRFMRERADLIGARLELTSDKAGTTVRLTIAPAQESPSSPEQGSEPGTTAPIQEPAQMGGES